MTQRPQSTPGGSKMFRTACLLAGLTVLCGAQQQTAVPTPRSLRVPTATTRLPARNAPKAAPQPSTLIGRVMSGDRPIAESEVTLYGQVQQCIPDPCMGVNRPVASARTDAHGFFAIDLSKAAAEVRNAIGQESVLEKERPDPGSLYLIASGGRVGTRANPAIRLMLAMGDPPPSGWVTINELTTVASVMCLLGVIDSPSIGFADAGDLAMMSAFVSPETGRVQPLLSEGVNSPALINTLADILSSCVRSDGPDARACARLFAASPYTGSTFQVPASPTIIPTDTLLAMRNLLSYKTRNVKLAFDLVARDPPYEPVLTRPPGAWMLSVNFARGGLKNPTEIAADPDRDSIWIANTGGDSVVELSTSPDRLGVPLSGIAGFAGAGIRAPFGIRVAPLFRPKNAWNAASNPVPSVWVANQGGKSVTLILPGASGGASLKEIKGHRLDAPSWIERFPNNEVDYQVGDRVFPYEVLAVMSSRSNAVSFFRSDGSACGPALDHIGLDRPGAIGSCYFAVSGLCVVNSGADELVLIVPPGHDCRGARVVDRIDGGGINDPQYFSVDWTPRLGLIMWITNRGNNSVSAFGGSNQLEPIAGSPLTGGGLDHPEAIVSDGTGQFWVANNGANTLTELSAWARPPGTPISPPGGFTGAGLNHPWGLAIDRHRNLWVANRGGNSVTMFVLGTKRQ